MIPEECNDSSSSPLCLVHYRCEPAYKWYFYATSNDRTWHHTMTATPAQLFSHWSLPRCLHRSTFRSSLLLIPHDPLWCLLFHAPSHFLSSIFSFFPFISASLSLALSTSVTLIKFAALTRASGVMLNSRQCNRPPGWRRVKCRGPTLY